MFSGEKIRQASLISNNMTANGFSFVNKTKTDGVFLGNYWGEKPNIVKSDFEIIQFIPVTCVVLTS